MGAPRRLAEKLLAAIVSLAPSGSRDWAQAMLRELDFIRGDWAALFWALGSAAAICRHVAGGWRSWFKRRTTNEVKLMNSTGKRALGVGMGALSALMLVGCTFALLRITDLMFPAMGIAHKEWTHWLAVIVIPDAIFIVAAIALWKRKGPVAAGILTAGLMMALHLVVHLAMR
jgi:hypothetical protein